MKTRIETSPNPPTANRVQPDETVAAPAAARLGATVDRLETAPQATVFDQGAAVANAAAAAPEANPQGADPIPAPANQANLRPEDWKMALDEYWTGYFFDEAKKDPAKNHLWKDDIGFGEDDV